MIRGPDGRRVDGRVVIAAMLALGVVFVLLNLFLRGGPDGGRVLAAPTSSPATVGISYRVRLLSACSPAVDFDGSFWTAPGRRRLVQPVAPSWITLVSGTRAILRTGSGQRIPLRRHASPLRIARCAPSSP